MSVVLDAMDGVVCLMDDILIHGKTKAEHDSRLLQVLQHLDAAKITLNKEKCEFFQSQVKFLGQMVDRTGVCPDPTTLENYHLAEKTRPLRELLHKDSAWL